MSMRNRQKFAVRTILSSSFPHWILLSAFITIFNGVISESGFCENGGNHMPGRTCYLNLTNELLIKITSDPVNQSHQTLFIASELDYVPKEVFKKFPNVTMLVLNFENLKGLSSNISSNNLRILKIMKSQIQRLDRNTFNGTPNLQELDLYENPIKNIDTGVFDDLNGLKVLDLRKTECIDSKIMENFDNHLFVNCTFESHQNSNMTQASLSDENNSIGNPTLSTGQSSHTWFSWPVVSAIAVLFILLGLGIKLCMKIRKSSNFIQMNALEAEEHSRLLSV